MPMKEATYADVSSKMLPGDVLAFSGASFLTRLISPKNDVSHAGLILEAGAPGIAALFVESTVHVDPKDDERKPVFGVRNEPANRAVSDYDGRVWWLPLSAAARGLFNQPAFTAYVETVRRAPYNLGGGIMVVAENQFQAHYKGPMKNAANKMLMSIPMPDDATSLFCSELVAGALKAGGVAAVSNIHFAHPSDVTSWKIYEDTYYLLKGGAKEIADFNTTAPGTI